MNKLSYEETRKSTYISSDEELIMLRHPRAFPTINRACMDMDYRTDHKNLWLIDEMFSFSRDPDLELEVSPCNEDSAYLRYAITRNQTEENCLLQFSTLMRIIQKSQKLKEKRRKIYRKQLKSQLLTLFLK